MLNEDLIAQFGDIYDQSKRQVYNKPTSLCRVPWAAFVALEEQALVLRPDAHASLNALCARMWHKLYGGVVDHSPNFAPRFLQAVVPVAAEPELAEVLEGEADQEPEAKRGRTDPEAGDDLSKSI
jgi:hypothetical protein